MNVEKRKADIQKRLIKLMKLRASIYPDRKFDKRDELNSALNDLVEYCQTDSADGKTNLKEGENPKLLPIFIWGYMKTGTSLLLSLFDGHPELMPLLVDSAVFRRYYCYKNKTVDEIIKGVAENYAKRIFNPDGKEPYNIISSKMDTIDFEKYSLFFDVFRNDLEKNGNSFSSIVNALVHAHMSVFSYKDTNKLKFWVDKSALPSINVDIERQLKYYPNSKFVFVFRYPIKSISSLLRWRKVSNASGRSNFFRYVYEYRGILKEACKYNNEKLSGNSHFLIYDELIENSKEELTKLSNFLDIEWTDNLITPTVNGKLYKPNASTKEGRASTGKIHNMDSKFEKPRNLSSIKISFIKLLTYKYWNKISTIKINLTKSDFLLGVVYFVINFYRLLIIKVSGYMKK